MFLLVGCNGDPWRAAIANERNIRAENSQALTAAQISQSTQAQADARNAQALLQGLQAQQATTAGQAVIAQAGAQTALVVSNNETLVLLADRIIEATRPDHRPLYAGLCAIVVVIVTWLFLRRPPRQARGPLSSPELVEGRPVGKSPIVVYQTRHAIAWLLPDETIVLHRYRDGREIVYLPGDAMYSRLTEGQS